MPPILRFFLRLMLYGYKLQFITGKELVLAYMLSMAAPAASGGTAGFIDVQVHAVGILSSLVSEAPKLRFAEETSKHPELQKVVENITGNKGIEGELKPFASELSVVEGINARRESRGYLGLNKCKARDDVWFSGQV